LLPGERPVDVVPEDIDLAVVGEEFADKAVGVVDETLAGGWVGGADGSIGMVPVHEGVIEADFETLSAGGFDELAYEISLRTLLHGVVVSEFGVPHAEAFVVLGGHDHVLLAGTFGESCPLAGGSRFGLKMLREEFILRNGDAFGFHDPLLVADDAVKAPVDEHAELCLLPPSEALSTGFFLDFERDGCGFRLGSAFFLRGCGLRMCECESAGGGGCCFDKVSSGKYFAHRALLLRPLRMLPRARIACCAFRVAELMEVSVRSGVGRPGQGL